MAGFGPVGSFPVASLPGGGGGTNYQPTAAGVLNFRGAVPTVTMTFPAVQLGWIGSEVLHTGVSVARLGWIGVEVLRSIPSVSDDIQMWILW